MSVRFRVPSDDGEWLRLRTSLWPDVAVDEHRVEMAAWLARSDAAVLVAPSVDDTMLVGFAEVGARSLADGCETSPLAYLEGWYVDVGFRRKGVGAALLRGVEAWARLRGYHEIGSDAQLENIVSQQAHISLGYKEVERSVLYLKKL
jgi:aminoglycoside 6'-N-acetyltransferase I